MTATEQADKRPLNEIEAIFAEKAKKRKKGSEPTEKQAEGKKQNRKKKRRTAKSGSSSSGNPSSASQTRKKTEEGLTVYTEEELGFNKKEAGGTPLCPFDCDCCF